MYLYGLEREAYILLNKDIAYEKTSSESISGVTQSILEVKSTPGWTTAKRRDSSTNGVVTATIGINVLIYKHSLLNAARAAKCGKRKQGSDNYERWKH